tara:strand:- start:6674 stop:6997 length:324 start_codon:yes stop_codon:yes gene_type:complete
VVDEHSTKKEQLEIFINSAYMGSVEGEEIYGFSQPSKVCFDKEFSQLSDDEYLSLVAMLIGPSQFNVITESQANSDRVERIKSVISGEYQPKKSLMIYITIVYNDWR